MKAEGRIGKILIAGLIASAFPFLSPTPSAGARENEARRLYRQAERKLVAKQYEEAVGGYQEVVSRYPRSGRADNAQYKIGFIHFHKLRRYREAEIAERELLVQYPESRFNDDAKYKLAQILKIQGKDEEAEEALEELKKEHPHSFRAGRRPPGWTKGKKVGWGGHPIPPGLRRKGGEQEEEQEKSGPPGWERGRKKGWRGKDLPPGLEKKREGKSSPEEEEEEPEEEEERERD